MFKGGKKDPGSFLSVSLLTAKVNRFVLPCDSHHDVLLCSRDRELAAQPSTLNFTSSQTKWFDWSFGGWSTVQYKATPSLTRALNSSLPSSFGGSGGYEQQGT